MSYFDKVFFINLKRRPDRLANFRRLQQENGWKLPEPIIFEAIEGDKVGVPGFFTQGGGAWGCLRSHCAILERCVMDGVDSVLMLEDDLTWHSDVWKELDEFMRVVPNDWQQLMLGGQHIRSPIRMESILRCTNCQRTHAYAVRGSTIKSLLNLWYHCSVHIDWKMGEWQQNYKVYAPEPFIFGQAGGKSDISGQTNAPKFWSAPKDSLVVHLSVPPEIIHRLRGRGFHMGYRRNDEGYDLALCDYINNKKPHVLANLIRTLLDEVFSDEGKVACIHHPEITTEEIKQIHNGDLRVIKGNTVEEVMEQAADLGLKPAYSASHILLLRAPRQVVDNLGGFHRGYWIDPETGMDNGQREIAICRSKTPLIKQWLRTVGEECERIGAVPLIWHDGISAEDLQEATLREVVEIQADTVEEVMKKWKESI